MTQLVKIPQNADDIDRLLKEHREMVQLLTHAYNAIKTTQKLYASTDEELLMRLCKKIQKWLDEHQ